MRDVGVTLVWYLPYWDMRFVNGDFPYDRKALFFRAAASPPQSPVTLEYFLPTVHWGLDLPFVHGLPFTLSRSGFRCLNMSTCVT